MSDIFIEDEKKELVTVDRPKKKLPPPEYLPIKLSSNGKLYMPSVLHVRDYTGEDALSLSMATENNILDILISLLQNMIWEGIDPMYLHEKELEEIMLNIYVNFWSKYINNYPYPFTDEEFNLLDKDKQERIKSGQESLTIDIDITKLKSNMIKDEFKTPLVIKDKDGTEVHFQLPCIKDFFTTRDYLEKKYKNEIDFYRQLEKDLEYNENVTDDSHKRPIDESQLIEYKKYIEQKATDFFRVKQSLLLVKYGNKKLETLQEKLEYYKKVTFKMWNFYNSVLTKYADFGVSHDVEMISPIDKTLVTRRCLFQFVDFIPRDDLQQSEQFTIQFGDK